MNRVKVTPRRVDLLHVTRRRAATRTCAAAVLAVLGSLFVAPAAPLAAAATVDEVYAVPADGSFTVDGHGWGHGRGMSQYGAQGAATLGKTARQITDFYYPGTTWASIPNAQIRVRLSADEGRDTVVRPATGLAVTDLKTGTRLVLPNGPLRWRAITDAAGLRLQSLTGSTWTTVALGSTTTQVGPLSFGGPAVVRLDLPDGTSRDYRGAIRAVRLSSTALASVDVLSLEDYLLGVVPREAISSWLPAALQAQAVAARTYSAAKRAAATANPVSDICDTTQCQVFGGTTAYSAAGTPTQQEVASTTQAVRATAGIIRTYGGTPATTEFSSSNGGWSTVGDTPYLVAQRDDWDGVTGNSVHTWVATLTAAQIQAAYPAIGRLLRVRVTQRDGNGEWGGRVQQVVLEGVSSTGGTTSVATTGSKIMDAHSFPAYRDGLRSSWWHVRPEYGATPGGPVQAADPASGSVLADGRTVVVPFDGAETVLVPVRNTGTVSWPAGPTSLVRLGTSPHGSASVSSGADWLSPVRPSALSGTTPVAPGSTGLFALPLHGNGRPVGAGTEAFGPLWEGVYWLDGGINRLTIVRVDPHHSRVAEVQTAPPATLSLTNAPTGTATLVVRLRNLGSGSWTVGTEGLTTGAASPFVTPAWPDSAHPPALAGNVSRSGATSVAPGEVGEWRVPVSASARAAGSYPLTLRPFGPDGTYGPTTTTTVTVKAATFTAQLVGMRAAPTVPSAGTERVWFDVQNTGNVAWPVHELVRSAAQKPGGSPSYAPGWIGSTRPGTLTSNLYFPTATTVEPGQVARFVIVLAGNGRPAGAYSEPFTAVWEFWRFSGLTVTVPYRIG